MKMSGKGLQRPSLSNLSRLEAGGNGFSLLDVTPESAQVELTTIARELNLVLGD